MDQIYGVAGEQRQFDCVAFVDNLPGGRFRWRVQRRLRRRFDGFRHIAKCQRDVEVDLLGHVDLDFAGDELLETGQLSGNRFLARKKYGTKQFPSAFVIADPSADEVTGFLCAAIEGRIQNSQRCDAQRLCLSEDLREKVTLILCP